MSLHRQIAVDGVGYGHKILSRLGLWSVDVEVIVVPGYGGGGGGSGVPHPITLPTKLDHRFKPDEYFIVIKYENKILSKINIKKSVAKFTIKVIPILQSSINFIIKLVKNIPKFRIKK